MIGGNYTYLISIKLTHIPVTRLRYDTPPYKSRIEAKKGGGGVQVSLRWVVEQLWGVNNG